MNYLINQVEHLINTKQSSKKYQQKASFLYCWKKGKYFWLTSENLKTLLINSVEKVEISLKSNK